MSTPATWRTALAVAALVASFAALRASGRAAERTRGTIVGISPDEVKWFTPPYYTDGRQRAQLVGDSTKPGTFVDRVKIPKGGRVRAHTHADAEIDTVLEGTWYVGVGDAFDPGKLKPYRVGSLVVIPAGVPHFVAALDGEVVVQIMGQGPFRTEYVEKSFNVPAAP
jgi:quercetin dioxygenase-like cupin family protein